MLYIYIYILQLGFCFHFLKFHVVFHSFDFFGVIPCAPGKAVRRKASLPFYTGRAVAESLYTSFTPLAPMVRFSQAESFSKFELTLF